METVLNKLKQFREKKGFSLDKAAALLGISKSYYWQVENGKRNLYYKMAVKIADLYNKKPDEIFYDHFKNK